MSFSLHNNIQNTTQGERWPAEDDMSNRVVTTKDEAWPLSEALASLNIHAACKCHNSIRILSHAHSSEAMSATSPPTIAHPFLPLSGHVAPQRLRAHLAVASDNRLGQRVLEASNNYANSISIDIASVATSPDTPDQPNPKSDTDTTSKHTPPTSSPHGSANPLPDVESSPAKGENRGENSDSRLNTCSASSLAPLGAAFDGAIAPPFQPPAPTDAEAPPVGYQDVEQQQQQQQQTRPPCPCPGPAVSRPQSVLLAVSASTPLAMHRPNWSVGDYDIERRVFKGGMSSVYKATCQRTRLPVALKVYLLSRVPSNAVHMLSREITIHSDLNHENIVTMYGAFQEEGRLVLVQEFAGRGDLHCIHRGLGRRLSEEQVQGAILAPFLEALAHLHSRGVCHRDIKPENIMFTEDWRLKVGDFGVSIDLNQERAVTRAGTLDYMAPEVERCPIKQLPHENKNNASLAYTTAVDIWATGVLVYELLVGFPPCVVDRAQVGSAAAACDASLLAGGGSGGCGKALSLPSSVSPGARDFISAALQDRPEDRPTALALMRHPWVRRGAVAARAAA